MKVVLKSMTLLELLVVVVIVGIIATFAVSKYNGVVKASVEAKARYALALIAHAEKVRRADSNFNAYLNIASAADLATLSTDTGIGLEGLSKDKDWTHTVANSVATATGKTGRQSASTKITYNFDTKTWTSGGILGFQGGPLPIIIDCTATPLDPICQMFP